MGITVHCVLRWVGACCMCHSPVIAVCVPCRQRQSRDGPNCLPPVPLPRVIPSPHSPPPFNVPHIPLACLSDPGCGCASSSPAALGFFCDSFDLTSVLTGVFGLAAAAPAAAAALYLTKHQTKEGQRGCNCLPGLVDSQSWQVPAVWTCVTCTVWRHRAGGLPTLCVSWGGCCTPVSCTITCPLCLSHSGWVGGWVCARPIPECPCPCCVSVDRRPVNVSAGERRQTLAASQGWAHCCSALATT